MRIDFEKENAFSEGQRLQSLFLTMDQVFL